MINRAVRVFLLSLLFIAPAFADPGRIPNAQGNFYFSIEGGFQKGDGSSVAAHGNILVQDDFNPDAAAAAGVFTQPEFARSIRVNESPGADQENDEESVGGPVSIYALSTTDNSNAETDVAADTLGFLEAFANVFANSSNEFATADAVGGPSIKAEHSEYVGITLGYGFARPLYGVFDRVEAYGTISTTAEEKRTVDGAAAAISVDGTSAFAAVVIIPDGFEPTEQDFGAITTKVNQSVDYGELGLRFKADRWNYGSILLTVGLEGFYVHYGQNTSMNAEIGGAVGDFIGADFWRNADVEGDLLGPMLSLEGQMPIEGTALSLVGRGFGGFYHLNADGQFADNFGLSAVSDDLSEWGYRVGIEAGFRVDLSRNAFFSVTGVIDHFSDVPTAVLPTTNELIPAHVDTGELTNYKLGGRLTFVLSEEKESLK